MSEPALRRRRHAAGENDLDEPLLGYDPDSEAHRAAAGRGGDGGGAIVPYSLHAYEFADLLRGLVSGAVTGLRGIALRIQDAVSWWRQPRQKLTVAQTARLEVLRRRIAVPYDGSNPHHQEALRSLWDFAFPGEGCPGVKCERWKDMGWQGTDPGTDFRGAGFISLENHLYMARRQPALFDKLRHKREGARSEWEYPFAVAGVNLTFMLIESLQLRDSGRLPRSPAGVAFLRLLGDDGKAKSRPPVADAAALQEVAPFEELYCASFALLDRHWLAARATYMEFPAVMKSTRRDVEAALTHSNNSLERALLLIRSAADAAQT